MLSKINSPAPISRCRLTKSRLAMRSRCCSSACGCSSARYPSTTACACSRCASAPRCALRTQYCRFIALQLRAFGLIDDPLMLEMFVHAGAVLARSSIVLSRLEALLADPTAAFAALNCWCYGFDGCWRRRRMVTALEPDLPQFLREYCMRLPHFERLIDRHVAPRPRTAIHRCADASSGPTGSRHTSMCSSAASVPR